jgi:hypothetical protein
MHTAPDATTHTAWVLFVAQCKRCATQELHIASTASRAWPPMRFDG